MGQGAPLPSSRASASADERMPAHSAAGGWEADEDSPGDSFTQVV